MREAAVISPSRSVGENLYRPSGTQTDLKLFPDFLPGLAYFALRAGMQQNAALKGRSTKERCSCVVSLPEPSDTLMKNEEIVFHECTTVPNSGSISPIQTEPETRLGKLWSVRGADHSAGGSPRTSCES